MLRATAALLAWWYVPFLAFALFYPYCYAGHEPHMGVCYLGDANYGDLYQRLCWISFFWAVPMVALIFVAFLCLWARRRGIGVQAA